MDIFMMENSCFSWSPSRSTPQQAHILKRPWHQEPSNVQQKKIDLATHPKTCEDNILERAHLTSWIGTQDGGVFPVCAKVFIPPKFSSFWIPMINISRQKKMASDVPRILSHDFCKSSSSPLLLFFRSVFAGFIWWSQVPAILRICPLYRPFLFWKRTKNICCRRQED